MNNSDKCKTKMQNKILKLEQQNMKTDAVKTTPTI